MAFFLVNRVWTFVGGSQAAVPFQTCETEDEAVEHCKRQKQAIDEARENDPDFLRVLQGMGCTGVAHSYVQLQSPGDRVIMPTRSPLVLPGR